MENVGDAPHFDLSIVLCTRNRARQLRLALDAWAQVTTEKAYELIVIDNMSTDATQDELTRARPRLSALQVFREERIGLGAARDAGWRLARAPLVAFTDDDCYPAPDYVDRMIEVFDEDADLAFMGGQIRLFDPEDLPETIDLRREPEAITPHSFIAAGAIQGANLCFRRSAIELVGGFDPRLGAGTPFPCEDIDLVARLIWSGMRGKYDPRPVVSHHHGRRGSEELSKLHRSYDRGRGAYYAKFLMRSDSRPAYAAAWLKSSLRIRALRDVRRVFRELDYAFRFLRVSGWGRPDAP